MHQYDIEEYIRSHESRLAALEAAAEKHQGMIGEAKAHLAAQIADANAAQASLTVNVKEPAFDSEAVAEAVLHHLQDQEISQGE